MDETESAAATPPPTEPTGADEPAAAASEIDDGDFAEASPEAAPPREELRYPLAFDANGNPVKVPAHARAWRVRRGGGKRGRPRNVFDATTGRQLEVPLGASIDDLIATNVQADRYLLYPVDAEGAIIPGVIAVTEVPESDDDEGDDDRPEGSTPTDKDPVLAALMSQQEMVKGQQDVIKAQSEYLARALASAVSGYAPVRPVAPVAPTPIMMEQPAMPAAQNSGVLDSILNMKPEQMMQIAGFAKMMFDMIKGAGAAGPPPTM